MTTTTPTLPTPDVATSVLAALAYLDAHPDSTYLELSQEWPKTHAAMVWATRTKGRYIEASGYREGYQQRLGDPTFTLTPKGLTEARRTNP